MPRQPTALKRLAEVLYWTWTDVRALPRLWRLSLERRCARLLLDRFGDALKAEMAFRHMVERANQLGAKAYCLSHDCDWSDCPPECQIGRAHV